MTPGPQDRATVVTATIVQVFKRSLLAWFDHGDANVTAARRELEAILRDEIAEVARETLNQIRREDE